MSEVPFDISPEDAAALLEKDDGVRLLDVRQADEWLAARIEGSLLLTEALAREILDEWPRETPVLVICHHGIRSRSAALGLRNQGFTRARNLAGGIEAWSMTVDPTVPRYAFLPGEGLVVRKGGGPK